jgi:hypothetical protein
LYVKENLFRERKKHVWILWEEGGAEAGDGAADVGVFGGESGSGDDQ